MKLFIVVRSDLPPGAQLAQSDHAAIQFTLEHLELVTNWNRDSNNLVVLAALNEAMLQELARTIPAPCTLVHEPDLDNALTAVAFGPTAARFLSSLPLALRLPKAA